MKTKDFSYYSDGITSGSTVALSQAITLIESAKKEHQQLAQQIVNFCLPHSGNSVRVGITGVPGVGKSTFIDAFGTFLTSIGKKVAVLAIDPTSQQSRGSILGDKTRMDKLAVNPNAYIRPSASGKTLGGVGQKTHETILLCEAAGFDVILVETVGVGQSETEVYSMTDFFLLLMIAGAGDELQGIKRGIMEMADTILINKAEGDNLNKAKQASREYANALHLFPAKESDWIPKVELCSAIEETGIEEAWKIIESYVVKTQTTGYFEENRKRQTKDWFYKFLNHQILASFYEGNGISDQLKQLEQQVLNGELSPFEASRIVLGKK
ncbi:MAG: methylmalonyl Co-A mutase-associated GTPase MeaB [Flavobacteriales bacterium]|nr:methylmalonyl Co-A mutase-associated GTPase MeaB [Flavobacteriales bacterium]